MISVCLDLCNLAASTITDSANPMYTAVSEAPLELSLPAQAYDRWLQSDHAHLFIINNDVLVPHGVLAKLMHAMRDGGALNLPS